HSFISFSFISPSTPQTYTLSLHDALPIFLPGPAVAAPTLAEVQFLCHRIPPCRAYRAGAPCESFPMRADPSHRSPRDRCEGSARDRKSTRLNSSHVAISYAVFCLKKKKNK